MTLLKKCLPDVLAVLLFAVLAFAYFFPADIEGRILYRHDASAGRGAGQEGIEYLQKTGERSRWTNALFGGMPTYQMAPSYGSTNLLTKAVDAYHLWLPENVSSGPSPPISSLLSQPDISGRYGHWPICRR